MTMKFEKMIAHPSVNNGEPIPLYTMDGFINTVEGWQMLVDVQKGKVSKEDYKKAKAKYYENMRKDMKL